MTPRPKGRGGEDATDPTTFASTTPPEYPNARYDFTLQAVMELHKSVGQLTESVNGMRDDIKAHGEKLEKFDRIFFAASVLGMIALVVGGFLINKLWDPVVAALKAIAKLP